MKNIKVFVDNPAFFIRKTNTDIKYMKKLQLMEEMVNLTFIYPESIYRSIYTNYVYIKNRFFPSDSLSFNTITHNISKRKLQSSRADVVISHDKFPINCGATPVVWQHGVVDPDLLNATGISENKIEDMYRKERVLFDLSAKIQLSSEVSRIRHCNKFEDIAEKFVNVPFFMPHIKKIKFSDIESKYVSNDKINIIFVGHDAHRKGLDIAFKAIEGLDISLRKRIKFTVISKKYETCIDHMPDFELELHKSMPFSEVQPRMMAADIYLMPSRFESFGFTFVEAMACGCAVIAPDGNEHRELCANGAAGVNVKPGVAAVRSALEVLCDNAVKRREIAQAGFERFQKCYAPEVSAQKHYEMFAAALS